MILTILVIVNIALTSAVLALVRQLLKKSADIESKFIVTGDQLKSVLSRSTKKKND